AVQIKQRTDTKPHTITLEEYERMCEAGVFAPQAHVELIRGEIVDMVPPGAEHEACVARLDWLFNQRVANVGLVWPQGNAIRLPDSNSRPQPDITILRWRDDFYQGKRPTAEDVILLVEVSESSLTYDRGSKRALYAEAGIAEYWVVNLLAHVVEVYTEPRNGAYQTTRIVTRGETLALPGELSGQIAVTDIVGDSAEG
ncbi:MAG TPA: Uma2 family endonuclease, partial [Chloroflexia bacterium]|nr:Uma2 family endonuclease [Chloroflexia bacterium]